MFISTSICCAVLCCSIELSESVCCFISSIDCFCRFPGSDYRNPAPGVFKKLREAPDPNSLEPEEEEEMIEVEVALPGEQLPQAVSASALDPDIDACEVEVVVDFGVDSSGGGGGVVFGGDGVDASSSSSSAAFGKFSGSGSSGGGSGATSSAAQPAGSGGASYAPPGGGGLKGDGSEGAAADAHAPMYESNGSTNPGKTKVNIFDPRKRTGTQSSDEQSIGWGDDQPQHSARPSQDPGRSAMPAIPEAVAAARPAPASIAEGDERCECGEEGEEAEDADMDEDRNVPETAEEREVRHSSQPAPSPAAATTLLLLVHFCYC